MTGPAVTSKMITVVPAFLLVGLLTGCAWAGDSTLLTRENYDLLMRWINFIILAVVIVKYGHKPLIQFLDNQKKEVTRSLTILEEKKKAAEALVDESRKELDDSREKLARIKERIIAEGQNRKEQLILEAQSDVRNMIQSTQVKIQGQVKTAYANIKAELVDMAADIALAKLPDVITPQDQDQWVEHWMASVGDQSSAAK